MLRSAPLSAAWCAADPGPIAKGGWVPALRSSATTLHRVRDTRPLLLPPPCGRRRVDDVVNVLAPAQNLHREHRMIKTLQVQIIDRPRFDEIFHHAVDAPRDHDLAGFRLVAQPRGEVGDRADRGIFEPLLEADLPQRRIAERDADAEAQTMP